MKPLLLLDVDGPLNPWAASNRVAARAGYRTYRTNPQMSDGRYWKDVHGESLKVRLKREHGDGLRALADVFDLVWATSWEHDANVMIGPYIGLSELPVIEFSKHLPDKPPEPGLHWKTAVIAAYAIAHQRPFAWVDDEVKVRDGLWFAKWCPHPFLTKLIAPEVGLTAEDFAELREWAEETMEQM